MQPVRVGLCFERAGRGRPRHPQNLPIPGLMKACGLVLTEQGRMLSSTTLDHHTNTVRVDGEPPNSFSYFVGFLNDLKAFFPDAGIYSYGR